MIIYKENYIPCKDEIFSLYSSNNWSSYTNNMDRTMKGISNSLFVIAAYDDSELVGLVRVVGDGETIIYIQDLLVNPSHHKQGIGNKLMEQVLNKYNHVRQKVLLTDASKETKYVRDFYEKLGFTTCDKGITVGMARFEKN